MVSKQRKKLISLLALYVRNKQKSQRKCWIRPIFRRRQEQGHYHNLVQELKSDPEKFHNFFRMDLQQFNNLLRQVAPIISKADTFWRKAISAEQKLSLALRYLASGDSLASLSYSFRLGRSTISSILREVLEALWVVLQPRYIPEPGSDIWLKTAEEFEKRWQFPNCIGAIDGKHVILQAPKNSGSIYYNYKGSYSIVLMAVADANCKFVYVDIGAAGSQSDGGIFKNCTLGKKLDEDGLNLPPPAVPRNGKQRLPFVFVADEAFPLKTHLMRPFSGRNLDIQRRIFNYRLSRARRCVENAFGIMASRFRIFQRPINTQIDLAEKIVKAAVCLHNFLKVEDVGKYCPQGYADYEDNVGNICAGAWRNNISSCVQSVSRVSSNNYSTTPALIREEYCKYFNSDGAVPWQIDIVTATH